MTVITKKDIKPVDLNGFIIFFCLLKVVRNDLNRMQNFDDDNDYDDDQSNSKWSNNDRENKWNLNL